MMAVIIIIAALVIGAGLMWAADFESGFVLLQYGVWSLETSFIVFIFAFVLLVVSAYMSLGGLIVIKKTPTRLLAWKKNQKQKRASQALTQGLIVFEEGRWREAERLLIKHASNSDSPLLHYLTGARAAQKQGASDRRDNYLRLAHETTQGADIAVGVVQAELQLDSGQKEQALATLQHLRDLAPKHPYILQLLQQLYADMEQWNEVQNVLPDLRKRHALPAAEVEALSHHAIAGQLHSALGKQDWTLMSSTWLHSPNKVRQTELLLTPYIEGLIQQGEDEQAMSLIEKFSKKQWSDRLIYLYGRLLKHDGALKQLSLAETWLKGRENNAPLLLTLARLAKENKLWAKAEEYIRSSLDVDETGEAYQVLAAILIADGKETLVADVYKKGLAVMIEKKG